MSQTLQQNHLSKTSTGWQKDLAAAFRNVEELFRFLELPPQTGAAGITSFPLLVPRSYAARMEHRNPSDPLLLQVLPQAAEQQTTPGFVADPVGDADAVRAPGLLQKYHGRALLVTTGACAVHCRYCFRREFPYHESPRTLEQWQPTLETIRNDVELTEVILSGGDPLLLSDDRLTILVRELDQIPHLERIRLHTRLPVVLPSRVTPSLLQLPETLRCQPVIVIHANHANELSGDCETAIRQLVRSGFPVLNQAVLLRGINDSVSALESLCRQLVRMGVMPYYLHQLDRVAGTSHFEVPVEEGRILIEQLTKRLPGYAVPRYVRETAGQPGKTPL
ncbi:MAG: EF-P beta-lysylation protein EpmB [Planctomycetaceae bacterium]|nr:EF-P beta-lysylation protein EpmB [Planctomycetaceae bacterium]